jgi:hypothetical protein
MYDHGAGRWRLHLLHDAVRDWVSNGRHLVEVPRDSNADFLAEHRRAYEAVEAERLKAADHESRVSLRVTQFIESGPPASHDSESPRGRLVAHIGWLASAREKSAAASDRLACITVAMDRRADAHAALTDLDESVRSAFGRWVQFGSMGKRPDDRVQERERLGVVLTETEADFQVAESAAFECDVAVATVAALEAMLPGLRYEVLTESATVVVADKIYDLVSELRECYGILAALGLVTENRALAKGFSAKLPTTPFGAVGFEVSASDAPIAVAGWRRALEALEANPLAEIVLPGAETKPPHKSALRRLLGVSTP